MKNAEMSLETIAKFILIVLLIVVLLFFVYKYILKGGQGAVDPILDSTGKKSCCVNKCVLHIPQSEDCKTQYGDLNCDTDCKSEDT